MLQRHSPDLQFIFNHTNDATLMLWYRVLKPNDAYVIINHYELFCGILLALNRSNTGSKYLRYTDAVFISVKASFEM